MGKTDSECGERHGLFGRIAQWRPFQRRPVGQVSSSAAKASPKSDLEDATEEELVNLAVETSEELLGGAVGAQAELGRRRLAQSRALRQAMFDLKTSTDRAAKIMIAPTAALVLFTLAILVLTMVIVIHSH